jgi:hypothetical protein
MPHALVLCELTIQPGAGQTPFALHYPWGDLQNFGSLLNAQSAEEFQFDDLTLSRIVFREGVQRVVDGNQVGGRSWASD